MPPLTHKVNESYLALYLRSSFSELDVVGLRELGVNTGVLALLPLILILVLETTRRNMVTSRFPLLQTDFGHEVFGSCS